MLFDKNSFNFGIIVKNEDYKWLEPRKLIFKSSHHKKDMVEDWHNQYDKFISEKDPVKYFLGAQITDDDVFIVDDFELPSYLQNMNVSTILGENSIIIDEIKHGVFQGIIGFTVDTICKDLILFQIFYPGKQLVKAGISFKFETDEQIFDQVRDSDKVISFRTSLTAVYQKVNKRLLFRSFRDTNSILKLRDHFQPSDEAEMRDVLNNPLFSPENIDEIISDMSYYNTVRIALIKRSGILDTVTAIQVKQASEKVQESSEQELPEIWITAGDSKIVFPVNKTEMRHLLKLLNDEYVLGLLTGNTYYASGRNPVS